MRQLTSSKTFYVFAVIHGRKQKDKKRLRNQSFSFKPFYNWCYSIHRAESFWLYYCLVIPLLNVFIEIYISDTCFIMREESIETIALFSSQN